MFIKNREFNDEDTLFEVLYDFEIGEPSLHMHEIIAALTRSMDSDEALAKHLSTLEEEDRLELYDDIKREQIVNILRKDFTGFVVEDACFYGTNDVGRVLLYSM